MATRKPEAHTIIQNCSFTNKVDEGVVETLTELARAARANAEAITNIAARVTASSAPMLNIEAAREE